LAGFLAPQPRQGAVEYVEDAGSEQRERRAEVEPSEEKRSDAGRRY
jgi:hypothetical protein